MNRRGAIKNISLSIPLVLFGGFSYAKNKGLVRNMQNVMIFDSLSDAKNHTGFSHGDRALVRSNGYTYEFSSARLLVDINPQSVIDFDNNVISLVSSGGMLRFCDSEKANVLHAINAGNFAAKIKDRTSAIIFDCYGDSITFGQSLPGASGASNTIGSATSFGDGSHHQQWQFNENYPKKLNDALSKFIPQSVSVNNLGYSGDRVWNGFNRHRQSTSADVAIIMYGINDCLYSSLNGSIPSGITSSQADSVFSYSCALRYFVLNQILSGKYCVLVGSTPFASLVGYDGSSTAAMKLVRAYNAACKAVASELGCVYVDTPSDIFSQYSIAEITQEGTHLNETGMGILANRLLSAIVSVERTIHVGHGSTIVINPAMVPVLSRSNIVALPNQTSSTPRGTVDDQKTTINVNENGVCIPFFTAIPDVALFINGLCSSLGASFLVSLDGGVIQSDYHFQGQHTNGRPASSKVVTKSAVFKRSGCNFSDSGSAYINVSSPGWHYLEIRKTAGSANVLIDSFIFEKISSVVSSDVLGCTARASVKNNALSGAVNIASVSNPSVGVYQFLFSNAMHSTDYTVIANHSADNHANIDRVFGKTTQGFSMSFMQGAGAGKGIDFQLYNPSSIELSVSGGR